MQIIISLDELFFCNIYSFVKFITLKVPVNVVLQVDELLSKGVNVTVYNGQVRKSCQVIGIKFFDANNHIFCNSFVID